MKDFMGHSKKIILMIICVILFSRILAQSDRNTANDLTRLGHDDIDFVLDSANYNLWFKNNRSVTYYAQPCNYRSARNMRSEQIAFVRKEDSISVEAYTSGFVHLTEFRSYDPRSPLCYAWFWSFGDCNYYLHWSDIGEDYALVQFGKAPMNRRGKKMNGWKSLGTFMISCPYSFDNDLDSLKRNFPTLPHGLFRVVEKNQRLLPIRENVIIPSKDYNVNRNVLMMKNVYDCKFTILPEVDPDSIKICIDGKMVLNQEFRCLQDQGKCCYELKYICDGSNVHLQTTSRDRTPQIKIVADVNYESFVNRRTVLVKLLGLVTVRKSEFIEIDGCMKGAEAYTVTTPRLKYSDAMKLLR